MFKRLAFASALSRLACACAADGRGRQSPGGKIVFWGLVLANVAGAAFIAWFARIAFELAALVPSGGFVGATF
jgi:hypothetical protein